jgi:hypothetical protein
MSTNEIRELSESELDLASGAVKVGPISAGVGKDYVYIRWEGLGSINLIDGQLCATLHPSGGSVCVPVGAPQ